MQGEIRMNNYFSLKSKVPFITDQLQPKFSACTGSAMCHISLTPLQFEARYGQENVSASRVEYPSLLTDLNLNCTACNTCTECHVAYFSHRTAMRGEIWMKNCFGLRSKVPFITDRLQPNLHCLKRICRECHTIFILIFICSQRYRIVLCS
jgi:hypothetical protein